MNELYTKWRDSKYIDCDVYIGASIRYEASIVVVYTGPGRNRLRYRMYK
jgi:hypothetical protein